MSQLVQRVANVLHLRIVLAQLGDERWANVAAHSYLTVNEFVIFTRYSDGISRQIAGLLHELAHLILGANTCVRTLPPETALEVYTASLDAEGKVEYLARLLARRLLDARGKPLEDIF